MGDLKKVIGRSYSQLYNVQKRISKQTWAQRKVVIKILIGAYIIDYTRPLLTLAKIASINILVIFKEV